MEEMNSVEIFIQLEQWMAELNLLAYQRLQIKNNDFEGISLLMVTQRIFNGYKATKLLIGSGFFLEATTIIRSVVEAVFVFNGIIDNAEETFSKLELLANHNKKKLHRTALSYDELKDGAKKYNFSNLESKRIGVFDLAGLSPRNKQLYEIVYGMLCDEVHVNQASLEHLLEIDNDVIKAIKQNHDPDQFETTYFTLFYCLHSVLSDLNKKYTLQLDSQLAEVEALLEKVLPK